MVRESPSGEIAVELDRQDVQHLLTHGSATVSKDVGPLTVKVRCQEKLWAKVVVDGPEEPAEEVGDS